MRLAVHVAVLADHRDAPVGEHRQNDDRVADLDHVVLALPARARAVHRAAANNATRMRFGTGSSD